MEEVKSFSIDDIELYRNDDNVDFAMAEIYFLAEGNNSHNCPIELEVLQRDAYTALGKFVIAKFDNITRDVTSHVHDQTIIGYIPPDGEIIFKEKDGKIFAVCQAVISKLYAVDVYNLFQNSNHRFVSCEFTAEEAPINALGEQPITAFTIHGITVLGLQYRPSCGGTEMKITKFSEEEALKFYNEFKFEENAKTYKINKTKLKDTPWGDVDKTELRNKVMEAKNKETLVHSVYALVEDGWEDAPSQDLKYPIMELIGDTFYYNRHALSSALGYAKTENENEVIAKIEKLYKKFKLDKGDVKEMSELLDEVVKNVIKSKKFGELEGRLVYDKVIEIVQKKLGKVYVEAIYDNHIVVKIPDKNKIIDIPAKIKLGKDDEEMRIDIDFDKQKPSKVQHEFKKKMDSDDAENDKKGQTPEDKAEVEEEDDKEDAEESEKDDKKLAKKCSEEKEMKCEEDKKEMEEDKKEMKCEEDKKEMKCEEEKEMSNNGNIDMAALTEMLKDETDDYKKLISNAFETEDFAVIMREMSKLKNENRTLSESNKKYEEDKKFKEVERIMESVKEELSDEKFKELSKEGMQCSFEELKNFEYKVGFTAHEFSKNQYEEKEKEMKRFSFANYQNKENKGKINVNDIYKKHNQY